MCIRDSSGVIAKTMETLVEFPDRELLGEDVIWSGDEDNGMLSSHRLFCTGTHLGDSMFGPATGKKVVFRAIADCYAINNSITDEWLVRDYGGIAKQLGWNSKALAGKIIEDEGGPDQCNKPLNRLNYQEGPYKGRGNENEWVCKYADTIDILLEAIESATPQPRIVKIDGPLIIRGSSRKVKGVEYEGI